MTTASEGDAGTLRVSPTGEPAPCDSAQASREEEKDAAPLLGGPANQREARLTASDGEESSEAVQFDIPEDAYGAAVLAICKNLPDLMRGNDRSLNLYMVIFALGINVMNLTLQFGVVYFINNNVVQPKVSEVQLRYKDFHENVFLEDGSFQPDLWENYEGKDELCEIAMTNRAFYWATLFLWIVVMLKEFRTSQDLFSNVSKVPGCESPADMLETQEENGETVSFIVKVTPAVRAGLYILVCVPKFVICFALLWLGCSWLSATTAFEDLVLNAVAMGFVTNIDTDLYDVLIPEPYKQEVADINFKLVGPKGDAAMLRRDGLMKGFQRSTMFLIGAVTYLLVYTFYLQNVLPSNIDDIKYHCAPYLAIESQPHCAKNIIEFFVNIIKHGSAVSTCYPYGPQGHGHADDEAL